MPGMYWQRVISIVCIYALLALSFDFLAHYVGLVSLGGAFFVGVGGYITALLNTELGFSPLVSIPAAAILGGIVCTILLLPCLPLRGVYFAIVTLMYPLLMTRLIEALDIFDRLRRDGRIETAGDRGPAPPPAGSNSTCSNGAAKGSAPP